LKLLIICSTLDLKYRLGCTPSWWQLFKAFHESGHDVITVPFLGDPVESLWWRTYPNPCALESKAYNSVLACGKMLGMSMLSGRTKRDAKKQSIPTQHIQKKWSSAIRKILAKEENIGAVLFISVPIPYISGIAEKVRTEFHIPVLFFEGDMPIALPQYVESSGYKFSYYTDADLSEFDAFFTNSKGVIPELAELGARNIHPLYYAVDPQLFQYVGVEKEIDISFFGYGTGFRETWIKTMITGASRKMTDARFVVGGRDMGRDLGRAEFAGDLSYSAFRDFCCRSRICLNITRASHASVSASSSARPFELAAFGACIVSNPCEGLGEWFETGKEIIVVKDQDDAIQWYTDLLQSEDLRLKIGDAARKRVLKDHTWDLRTDQMVSIIRRLAV